MIGSFGPLKADVCLLKITGSAGIGMTLGWFDPAQRGLHREDHTRMGKVKRAREEGRPDASASGPFPSRFRQLVKSSVVLVQHHLSSFEGLVASQHFFFDVDG
jgi:hypothetical protein